MSGSMAPTVSVTLVMLSNQSHCEEGDSFEFFFVPVVYSVVFCLGLPSNLLALLVFLQRTEAVKKVIQIYLLNLTIADILFNLMLPFWVVYYVKKGDWVFTEIGCRLAGAVYYVCTYSSITFMTLISINRYCIVTKRSNRYVSSKRGAFISCMLSWAFWFCCAIPTLLVDQTSKTEFGLTKCFEKFSQNTLYYFAVCGFFGLSFFMVLLTYVSIIRSLSAPDSLSQSKTPRTLAKAMVSGILLVFLICVAPYHITLVFWVIERGQRHGCFHMSALRISHWINTGLLSVNSCIDPLIYCFSLQRFRTEIKAKLLWLTKQRRPSQIHSIRHFPILSRSTSSTYS
ncbi:platelet-activating factor receptor-like [Polypterus senegalus]|uniref:platelet-activating factor receptor-like n=1 Tax=Polypterus senegalus TaxID=55291 RepID=UPI001966C808|nr:platelet-activating factor receptor-like [Polypterus senegalus]